MSDIYSKADIAKKLQAAQTYFNKNKKQKAVYLLYDALNIVGKQHPEAVERAWDFTAGWHIRAWGETTTGRADGSFSAASVGEEVTLATLALGGDRWEDAARRIYVAMAGLKLLAENKEESLEITWSPRAAGSGERATLNP